MGRYIYHNYVVKKMGRFGNRLGPFWSGPFRIWAVLTIHRGGGGGEWFTIVSSAGLDHVDACTGWDYYRLVYLFPPQENPAFTVKSIPISRPFPVFQIILLPFQFTVLLSFMKINNAKNEISTIITEETLCIINENLPCEDDAREIIPSNFLTQVQMFYNVNKTFSHLLSKPCFKSRT